MDQRIKECLPTIAFAALQKVGSDKRILTLFRTGGGGGGAKKDLTPYYFSPVIFLNLHIYLQNFLNFTFNPFATLE